MTHYVLIGAGRVSALFVRMGNGIGHGAFDYESYKWHSLPFACLQSEALT